MKLNFEVNGKNVTLEVSPKKRLLDILREDLDLIGTKEGCGKGECGACTVLLNGKAVNSCLVPAFQVEGSRLQSIEGIKELPVFTAIEKTYIEHGAVQCGFCMSGFVMSTISMLNQMDTQLTPDQIKWWMAGNLCRCTGYSKILQAVESLVIQPDIIQQIQESLGK